jgi:hypothetical protein
VTADEYLRRVAWELSDLPWGMRKDLLADLRAHLTELPDGTDLAELGSPEQYAADLRSAAGLEHRRGLVAFLSARRPRNVILVLVALIGLGLTIGALAWIASYQPLSTGNGAQYPPEVKPMVGSDSEQVRFRQGAPFEVGVSVVNTGRFTVRVLGSTLLGYVPVSARLVMSGPIVNHGGFPPAHRRFTPFDLKPGQVAFLVLRGTYDARCHPGPHAAQEGWAVGGFQVRFGFLWRTGTAEIALPSPLYVNGPKGMLCRATP